MNTESLSYKTLKNSIYGLIGYIWPILFSIFVTPLLVYKLGVGQFGLYILVTTIAGFAGLIDLGFANALLKYIAEYHAVGDQERLKKLIYSANTLLALLGILFILFFLATGFLINNYFPKYLQGSEYSSAVFFLAGLNMFVVSISGVFAIAPNALQRYDITTKIGITNLTFSNLAIWYLAKNGFGLKAIMLSQVVFSFFLFLSYYYYSKKILSIIDLKFEWFKEEIIKCYKYGIYIFLSNIGLSSFSQLDRLVMPAYLGTVSLTYYSLPGNITGKISGLVGSLTNMFFPMASGLSGIGRTEDIKKIYIRSIKFITVIASGLTVLVATFSYKILFFWINKDVADNSAQVLVILAFTFFLIAIASPLLNFLYGMGRARFLAVSSLTMAGINIVLLLLLLPRFGIVGAAWAYFGSALYIIFMLYYMEVKILHLSDTWRDYVKLYIKIIVNSIVFFAIATYLILPFIHNLWSLVFCGGLAAACYYLTYWLFGFFEKEDVELVKRFVLFSLRKRLNSQKSI